MATKAERGTKRTCQNSECGSRFYDLARKPIVCPICETVYELGSTPAELEAEQAEIAEKAARKAKRPEVEAVEPAEAADLAVGEEDIAVEDVEVVEQDIAGEADDTFLETDEEEAGGDVSGIIGGPVAEGEEEP